MALAPLGTIAPVAISEHIPPDISFSGKSPAAIFSPENKMFLGFSSSAKKVSLATTANPSFVERAKGGTSIFAIIFSAKTLPWA